MRTQKALAAVAASAMLLLLIGGIPAAQEKPQKAPQEKEALIEPSHSLEGKEEAKGQLTVFSEPPNLEVMLDGEKIGETPVAMEVKPGEHVLSIEGSEKTVVVLPGESLRLSLFKGEFIEIPEEMERPVAKAPEQPQRQPSQQQQEAPREKGQRPQYYHFYWPQNPKGPIF